MGVGEKLGQALVPPGIGQALKWRLTVSGSILAMLLWIAWAMGLGASIGLSAGLARADEVEKLSDQVAEVRASLLAEKIDAISAQLCMESIDSVLVEYRRSLQNEYREIKGELHQSPPCEILLKLKR